jgi:hypothetical protein
MAKNKHLKELKEKASPARSGRRGPEGMENCRCKDVATKTPKELLKVALEDLSFWKRIKKG